MYKYDELKIYRGGDIQITPKVIVTQPSLDQIEQFGEKRYFNAVHTLTAVGADMKWQLWDFDKIDYTQIEDYDLFIKFISQLVSSKKKVYNELMSNPEKYKEQLDALTEEELQEMLINPLELVLKDIDLADFSLYKMEDEHIILYDAKRDITIDRAVYAQIVDVVRKIHGFKRNNQMPANEATKMDLIDDARDEAMRASQMPYKSVLKPLISSLTVKCGLCGDDKIWNMKIAAFFDNIKRVSKIQDAELLLQGAYSGFASLKGVDKTRLDWTGDI